MVMGDLPLSIHPHHGIHEGHCFCDGDGMRPQPCCCGGDCGGTCWPHPCCCGNCAGGGADCPQLCCCCGGNGLSPTLLLRRNVLTNGRTWSPVLIFVSFLAAIV